MQEAVRIDRTAVMEMFVIMINFSIASPALLIMRMDETIAVAVDMDMFIVAQFHRATVIILRQVAIALCKSRACSSGQCGCNEGHSNFLHCLILPDSRRNCLMSLC